MKITRIQDAEPYKTGGHFDMVALRLQGKPATDCKFASIGLSHFLPGGGAEESASNIEKIYVVLSGQMTLITAGGKTILGPLDSCLLAAGEKRSLLNETNSPVSMLVIVPAH